MSPHKALPALALAALLTVALPGSAQAADPTGFAATGFTATLGGTIQITEARAAYPTGPVRADVSSARFSSLGTVAGIYAVTGEHRTGGTAAEAGVASTELDFTAATLSTGSVSARCVTEPDSAPTARVRVHDAVVAVPESARINVTGNPQPNTTLQLPGGLGQIVLNEQVTGADGSLTVNALRLTLGEGAGNLAGDVVIGSATCPSLVPPPEEEEEEIEEVEEPAEEEAVVEEGVLISVAEDADAGHGVKDVVFDVVDERGALIDSCTTDASGRCGVAFVPGDRTYYACVSQTPAGYGMPAPDEVCDGPYRVAPGAEVTIHEPFPLLRAETGTETGTEAEAEAETLPASAER
ncbi:choice-of-anchor P family protein [Streptomyces xiamenensis]|uniref:choice-of-anchor P family protein n=1 Tax=Streptomyces xiamenensis TaxID=408015 RepID=UPI0036E5D778